MRDYALAIRARARDGIASHGTLAAYINDFRASCKLFEMVVAYRMTREHGRAFLCWEDIVPEVKVARGLPHADTGIDVSDGTTTIVQCKLRTNQITWRDVSTFLACALDWTDGALHVPWSSVVVARNACSKTSSHYKFFARKLRFDAPLPLADVESLVSGLLQVEADVGLDVVRGPVQHELRDYQLEAVELCLKETMQPAYVVLPTGCGKSLVMAHVAARADGRVLVYVPLLVLLEQFLSVLSENGCEALAVGGGREWTEESLSVARVVVCVYNSAHKVDATKFKLVLTDEAHCVRAPKLYTEIRDDASDADEQGAQQGADAGDSARGADAELVEPAAESPETREAAYAAGYTAVRAASRLPTARLFSATQDVPDGAERCERTLRWSIDAGYLCDYALDVPVFDAGAGNADLARHIVRSYRSIIVYCATRAEGLSFCAAMNELGPCARYVDCETGRRERNDTLAAFKRGELAFIVNVRVLAMGFDAPITKGVCFVNMPASKTHIIQVIGRCLRPHPDKLCARVILPLVAGTVDEDKRARDFMCVLGRNDARLARALSESGGGYVSVRLVESAASEAAEDAGSDESGSASEDEGSADVADSAAEMLYTAVYDAMGVAVDGSFDRWLVRLDELVAYRAEHGCFPPQRTPLGRWVGRQRRAKETMDADRKARLVAMPWWAWNVLDEVWSASLCALVAYRAEHGRLPPQTTPLGKWASTQRRAKATMDAERKARLEALGWWAWNPRDEVWSANLCALVAYRAEHGRLPPQTTRLGGWVCAQGKARATMSDERKLRLAALGWWVWPVPRVARD